MDLSIESVFQHLLTAKYVFSNRHCPKASAAEYATIPVLGDVAMSRSGGKEKITAQSLQYDVKCSNKQV